MWKSTSHDDGKEGGALHALATSHPVSALSNRVASRLSGRATPSHMDKVLMHAAKTLEPYLKAMVAFGSSREFDAKPSQYRQSVAEKKPGAVALTVCRPPVPAARCTAVVE